MYFPDDVWKAHIVPLLLLPREEFELQKRFAAFKAEYRSEPEFHHAWRVFETEEECSAALEIEKQKWPEWVGCATRCLGWPHDFKWRFLVGLMPLWVPEDIRSAVRFEEHTVYGGRGEDILPSERAIFHRDFTHDLLVRLTNLLQSQYGSVCFSPLVVRDWYVAVVNDCWRLRC